MAPTSGKAPRQCTMSRDVLPQPPSPTITILSSLRAGPALGAAWASGASIAPARALRAEQQRPLDPNPNPELAGRGPRCPAPLSSPPAGAAYSRQPPWSSSLPQFPQM